MDFSEETIDLKVGGKCARIAFDDWPRFTAKRVKVYCTAVWSDFALVYALRLLFKQRSWPDVFFLVTESGPKHRILSIIPAAREE